MADICPRQNVISHVKIEFILPLLYATLNLIGAIVGCGFSPANRNNLAKTLG